VERRAAGEPVQYIIGRVAFRGLTLDVTPAVLIPRPETEEVAGELLRRLEGRPEPWVLDVGTGSGAIALAVKQERPDAEVFACDVSPDALDVAAGNAERLGLDVAFAPADALAPGFPAGRPGAFDAVVSNPPYVPETERAGLQREVRDWEPPGALFVPGDDPLLFYRALATAALEMLKPGGVIVVETHADHGDAVRALFVAAGLENATLSRDLAGRDRIVAAERPAAPI
jgi:release factor glutamine methyltransferase